MSGRGRPLSRSRRGEPPPPRAGAEEAKGSEEEDVEQVSAQAATAAHGMAAAASPNIEDVISLPSLSETQRQTIVEIVSLFPSLSELQLKSIETLVVSPYLQKQSIISLVVSGAAVSASGSPPVLSAELEKKFVIAGQPWSATDIPNVGIYVNSTFTIVYNVVFTLFPT